MDLIRRFEAAVYAAALESWSWLDGLAGMTPVLANGLFTIQGVVAV
jgi:hypothetical protein